MKNKLLLSLLAALGFVGCDKSNDIPEMVVYYGPGPNWGHQDITLSTQVTDDKGETINGIRVVASYLNRKDSLITDTAYTRNYEWVDGRKANGVAVNKLKFETHIPKSGEVTLEYTDVDGEENGSFQTKIVNAKDLSVDKKVTLTKKKSE